MRTFAISATADNPSLENIVQKAKDTIGLSDPSSSRVFSTDILRVELSGPQQPYLTIVDLPGLFEASNRN